MAKQMVFTTPPKKFVPKVEVVACCCFVGDTFLLLKRQEHKPQGNTWCYPAGKLEKDENRLDGLLREVYEETRLSLERESVSFEKTFYVRYPSIDFIYHVYQTRFPDYPTITLNNEHQDLCWATKDEALAMELIPGEKECISLLF